MSGRTRRAARWLACTALSGAMVAAAPQQSAPPQGAGQPLPWSVQLGVRVAEVEHRVPLVDRVVLVPDEATYLDEISRWSPAGQWPVLIEDEVFAPLFIRGFVPAKVVRRTDRAAPLPSDDAARRALLQAAVRKAWNVDVPPPGIVVTSMSDPAWTAAVALAAGRGQPVAFLDGAFGQPHEVLDAAAFSRLNAAINDCFKATGLPYARLGDVLDACTICRVVAARCTPDLPDSQRFRVAGAPPTNPADPLAVTDCLCRGENGQRWAFCGTIDGDSIRAAYTAQCALFMPRQNLCFFSAYPREGTFEPFMVQDLETQLEPPGYRAKVHVGSSATLNSWLRLMAAGSTPDVLFINSSGTCSDWDLGEPGKTPPSDHASWLDVPPLARPVAVHMVHSFSFQFPNFENTIAARWLQHGAYAYVGSVQEPFLSAFVPPRFVAERVANAVPFLVAARQWDGPFSVPWRVATWGDPLMLMVAPARPIRVRVPPADAADAARSDLSAELKELAREALKSCQATPTPAAFRDAFRTLSLLGDDRIAAQLWRVAAGHAAEWGADPAGASAAARAALGALARTRDADSFMQAWALVSSPDDQARDLLWFLMTPNLSALSDESIVKALAAAPRKLRPDVDLIRLAPAYARVLGPPATKEMLLKAAGGAKDPAAQQALRRAAVGY